MQSAEIAQQQILRFTEDFARVKAQICKVIVGQESVVDDVLIALLAGGHVLLEGVPGLGKTLLVRTLAQALDLHFSRIQFTPDLMPADITGTTLLVEDPASGHRRFQFERGPIFANLVLADEVNRATPKTQSALLEAMQEQSVTVAGHRHDLTSPFFVLATQNPIEMEGTYPLPEAQLDRFLFKILVETPTLEELSAIVRRTTGADEASVEAVIDAQVILSMRDLSRQVPMAPHVEEFAAQLVLATHPGTPYAPDDVNRFVRFGASPRGAQSIARAAKVRVLLSGRYNVGYEDIRAVASAALRHRIIMNYEGEAEGLTTDSLIATSLAKVAADRAVKILV